MIRNAESKDLPGVRVLAESTGMFLGDELESFMSEISSHLERIETVESSAASLVVAIDAEGNEAQIIGAAYFAPEMMAQGVMNLLFIGVLPQARKKGVGQALLDSFEAEVKERGARIAIIETASDQMFAPAWSLYKKAEYEEEARIRDYYSDSLDKVIFRKRP